MSSLDFLKKSNITMLWDVINDEEIFKYLPRDSQSKVSQLFLSNLNGFFEVEKKNTNNLIEINKKYIILILNYIKKNLTQQQPHNKIKIFNEAPSKEIITYEEIQNERQTQFEKDFSKRQEEFTNAMTLKVPQVPEFADKHKDVPISEMDKIIKEMTVKRNYEVEQINRTFQSDINSTNNWLKSQETSIKTEKLTEQNNSEFNQNQNYSKSKYINTLNETMLTSPKKNVTWGEDSEMNSFISEDDNVLESNIFQKLKKVDASDNISLIINDNTTEDGNKVVNRNINDDKILQLENQIKMLNDKMDKLINLFNNK